MKKLKNLVYIALGAGAVATVLRVLGVIFAFDKEVEYFDMGSPINIAASIVLLLLVALCVIVGFVFRSKLSRDGGFFKKTEKVSFVLGAFLLAYGVFELYRLFALKSVMRSNQLVWSVIGILLSFVAAAYFLGSFIGSAKRSQYCAFLGFGFVFWCAYIMAVNYFDVLSTLNNPLKLSMQFALLAAMFCLLGEIRIRLSNEKRGQHLSASLLTSILCAYFSIPCILAYALGKTQNIRYLFAAIACIAIAIYATRVCLLFSEADANMPENAIDNSESEADALLDNSSSEEDING